MAKDVNKLRILRRVAYPVLSRWALNPRPSVLMRERQREIRDGHKEKKVMWGWKLRLEGEQ